jgi:PAS domain S-box-containing protein
MTAMAGLRTGLAPAKARASIEPSSRMEATMVQQQEKSLEQTLARTGDGAFVIAGDGKIILWNRVAERMLGYTAREAIGRPCCDVLVGRDGNNNRLCYRGCHVMSLVKMGDPVQSFDMQTRTKSGRPIWLNFSILTTTNGHGGPVTIHLFRDVTATKELLNLVQERRAAPTGGPRPHRALTPRELEILRLLATGADTKTAAELLHLSRATVRNHVQNILGKLGVHSRLQAVAYATTHRLL